MYQGLVHLHSSFRYIVVILMIVSILIGISGLNGKKIFSSGNSKLVRFTVLSLHIQLLLGLILYFGLSPKVMLSDMGTAMKDAMYRFYTVEHITGMMIAIVIATIGGAKVKRATTDRAKFKKTFIFFSIAFLIVFFSIPWPFLKSFGSWM